MREGREKRLLVMDTGKENRSSSESGLVPPLVHEWTSWCRRRQASTFPVPRIRLNSCIWSLHHYADQCYMDDILLESDNWITLRLRLQLSCFTEKELASIDVRTVSGGLRPPSTARLHAKRGRIGRAPPALNGRIPSASLAGPRTHRKDEAPQCRAEAGYISASSWLTMLQPAPWDC